MSTPFQHKSAFEQFHEGITSSSAAEHSQPKDYPTSLTRAARRARSELQNAKLAIRAMRELLKLLPQSAVRHDPRLRKLRFDLWRTTPANLPKTAQSWVGLTAMLLSAAVTELHALRSQRSQSPAESTSQPLPTHHQTDGHAHASQAAQALGPEDCGSLPKSSPDSAEATPPVI